MKMFITVILALLSVSLSIDPPVWPKVWSQDFIQNYTYAGGQYSSARTWYDYSKNSQRVTYQNGQYDTVCNSVLPGVKTACTQLLAGGNLYVIYPQKQQCCRCCSQKYGCVIKKTDWLSQFIYAGEQVITGQKYYKWTYLNLVDYYTTQDEKKIIRRIHTNGYKTEDFIVNTYSEAPISDDIWKIPTYCKNDCSRNTICGNIQPRNNLTVQ